MCCRIILYGGQGAARSGAEVVESVVQLACPPGRSRLLRAGLPAVLARAGPAVSGLTLAALWPTRVTSLLGSLWPP